jgi:putative transferase (TIGR04331 family)
LVYASEYFELIPEAKELLEVLKAANIVFENPEKAALHINKVWPYLHDWWNSDEIHKAKQFFFDTALQIEGNWKKEWIQFLKSV